MSPLSERRESGLDWAGRVPAGWRIRRVKDVAALINGFPFDSAAFSKEASGLRIVRNRDLKSNDDPVYFDGQAVEAVRVDDADVLVGMDGDFNVAWWNGGTALLNQRLCCLRERQDLNRRFLFYLLPLPLKVVNDLTYYTTVKHLSSGQVASLRAPLPPLAVQSEIVVFLDRKTATIDALITKKKRQIELLEEKRQALITQAVTKGLDPSVPMKDSGVHWLGKIPASWSLAPLRRRLLQIEQGWSPACESRPADQGEWGVLKVGCVNYGSFNYRENKALPSELNPMPAFEVRPGDVLISRANTRELVGSAALVGEAPPKLMLCDKLFRLRYRPDDVYGPYLVFALLSSATRRQFERDATGASGSMQNIGQDSIRNLVLPWPPPPEQQALVAKLEALLQQAFRVSAVVEAQIDRLREYRQALISAAVTGKIDVSREEAA